MAVKTSTIYTTTDGTEFKKKTIANRHQRFLDAQSILQDTPDFYDGDDKQLIETFQDAIDQLGGVEKLIAILKDYQLGSQIDEK